MTYQLLIVDDDSLQFSSLSGQIESAGWKVIRAEDKEDAEYRIRNIREEKSKLDVVAIDLGLPPLRDETEIGLLLIKELRKDPEFEDLPILAYTSQSNIDYVKVTSALRQLLVMRTSFIYLRSLLIPLHQIIEQVRLGFVIYSPNQAGNLPSAVSNRPDPLDDELWKTLKSILDFPTQARAAENLNIATETIKTRLEKIRQILIDHDEIPIDATSEELKNWYRHNKVCFVRE